MNDGQLNIGTPANASGEGFAGSSVSARGFTLAEVLVAVAAVLILTVAIGQLFGSVQQLVGTSSAVGEVDQTARIIEDQLRSDFEGLRQMPQEAAFMVIRSVVQGDKNGNGRVDANEGERAIYVSEANRAFDIENGLDAYAPGSRAITTRMDDLVFLSEATADGAFYTQQTAGLEATSVSEDYAIVSWGIGLRPFVKVDELLTDGDGLVREIDVTEPDTYPIRTAAPDGILVGDAWYDAFGAEGSRNEYAGRFPLTRHTLLLAGGNGFTFEDGSRSNVTEFRAVAPFALDAVTEFLLPDLEDTDEEGVPYVTGEEVLDSSGNLSTYEALADEEIVAPRAGLIRHGRVDIVPHSLLSLRRWMEGQIDLERGVGVDDGTPFDSGLLDITFETEVFSPEERLTPASDRGELDSPLWLRYPRQGQTLSGLAVQQLNTRGVKQALAGLVTRRLVEDRPPLIRRVQTLEEGARAEDELLDLTGVVAGGCSRFEVAWSNGERWPQEFSRLEVAGPDGVDGTEDDVVIEPGELVWFDRDFTFQEYVEAYGDQPGAGRLALPPVFSEFDGNERSRRLGTVFVGDPDLAPYGDDEVDRTGGDPEGEYEYWSIWGFRYPTRSSNGFDQYGSSWLKPRLIRVRATLHDQQSRLEGGREFEMIFAVRD